MRAKATTSVLIFLSLFISAAWAQHPGLCTKWTTTNGAGWGCAESPPVMYRGGPGDGHDVSTMASNVPVVPSDWRQPCQVRFDPSPSLVNTAGVDFAIQPVVRIWDNYEHFIPTATNRVTLTINHDPSVGATLNGTTSQVAVAGEALFTDLSINKVGNGFNLQANSDSLLPAISLDFAVRTSLAITAPTSGVRWVVYAPRTIAWTSVGSLPQNVRIYYAVAPSYDAWTEVTTAAIVNVGSYSFTVADILPAPQTTPSISVKVKVVDAADAGSEGVSEAFEVIYYRISFTVKDEKYDSLLADLSVSCSSGWSAAGLISGNNTYHYYPYGAYTTTWSKAGYDNETISWTADADGKTNIVLMSTKAVGTDYQVGNAIIYDSSTLKYYIHSWLEDMGKIAVTPASCAVLIKDQAGTVYRNYSSSSPDTNGVFIMELVTADAPALSDQSSYVVPVAIGYKGETYSSIFTFSMKGGSGTDLSRLYAEHAAILSNTAAISSNTMWLGTSYDALNTQVGTLGTKVDTLGTKMDASLAGIDSIKTAVGAGEAETLYSKSSATLDATTNLSALIVREAKKGVQSKILNRPTTATNGCTVTIRYKTDTGKVPEISVYDPNNTALISSGLMINEIGSSGVYEYSLQFLPAWPLGEYTIICSEVTTASADSMTIKVVPPESGGSGDITAILAKLDALNVKLDGIAADQSTMKNDLASQSASMASLSNSYGSLAGDFSLQTTSLASLSNSYALMAGDFSLQTASLASLSNSYGSMAGDLSLQTASLASLSNSYVLMAGDFSLQTASLASLSNSYGSMAGDFSLQTASLATLSSDYTAMAGDISTIKGDLSSQTASLTTLSDNYTAMAGDITTIQSDIAAIKASLAKMADNVNTLLENWNSLDMAGLKANIDLLVKYMGTPNDSSGMQTLFGKIALTYGLVNQMPVAAVFAEVQNLRKEVNFQGKSETTYSMLLDISAAIEDLQAAEAEKTKETVTSEMQEAAKTVQDTRETLSAIAKQAGVGGVLAASSGSGKELSLQSLYDQMTELKAMSQAIFDLLRQREKPVVKSWLESGSVKQRILVANHSKTVEEVIPVKEYLPDGVKPEDIISKGDFKLGYDFDRSLYYVHQEVKLQPGASVTLEVVMKDIWRVDDGEIAMFRDHVKRLSAVLEKSRYAEQVNVLRDSIYRRLDQIAKVQNTVTATENRLSNYETNKASLEDIKKDIGTLEDLVVEVQGLPTDKIMGEISPVASAAAAAALPPPQRKITMKIEMVNPLAISNTAPLEYPLPAEIKPDFIADQGVLEVRYNPEKKTHYLSAANMAFAPHEKKSFAVELNDIWYIPGQQIDALRSHTEKLVAMFVDSEARPSAEFLGKRITQELAAIDKSQQQTDLTADVHIGNYRENTKRMEDVKKDIARLERLIVQTGGTPGLTMAVRDVKIKEGGVIPAAGSKARALITVNTWRIIWAIIAFAGIISFLFFMIWWMQIRKKESEKLEKLDAVEREGKKT